MTILIIVYGFLFCIGAFGNGTLAMSLGWARGCKSPLLFGLIVADFGVCCLSGPLTAAISSDCPKSPIWLVIADFMQALPLAASTISMMTLSIDRYFTVKNYRPIGHVATRRQLLTFAVATTWLASAICASFEIISIYNPEWKRELMIIRLVLVQIIPCFTVMLCHLIVHAKLTSISLRARAQHGELPLPIPLIRRPTHVIIVAGVPNVPQQIRIEGAEETVEEPQPATTTLERRRHLANCLLCLSCFFMGCWFPYIVSQLYELLVSTPPEYVQHITLYLGHMHSALGPLLYWSMNHHWPKGPCGRLRRMSIYGSNSSTNEAALGPFHPRFIRPPSIRKHSNSQYLY